MPETESEFGGDGRTGWAGDLGQSKGRVLTGGERAALLRRAMRADLPESED
ncbi:MAG: hypothetical protein ACRDVN_11755 [Jiangellaceae bacterium]